MRIALHRQTLNTLDSLLGIAYSKGYKLGWCWHELQNLYPGYRFELRTLQAIAMKLGYNPGWAFHQFKKVGAELDPETTVSPSSRLSWAFTALGIEPPIDRAKLKRAYRQAALVTHPDAGGTAERFRMVADAYQALAREVSA